MKRLQRDLVALGIAACGTIALFALSSSTPRVACDGALSAAEAKREAAGYLAEPPRDAQRHGRRWIVTDGHETAWLDAHTGDLVEIEFSAR
jgi:hypothetical protein